MKPKANYMIGIISYIPETEKGKMRIPLHLKQLRWLEELSTKVRDSFEVYRVQSGWGDTANEQLTTTLDLKPIIVDKHTCAQNRNFLLEKFYESDYDWLFLLDDDRMFFDHYRPADWFDDLSSTRVMLNLCKSGYLVSCLLPMFEPYKKTNYAWELRETHWYFDKDLMHGSLQSCFIPNIKKYMNRTVFFDNETEAQLNEPPEDTKFQLDWIKAGGRCVRNRFLIGKEIGQSSGERSLIYDNLEYRREVEKSHAAWFSSYVKELFPRNPRVWTRKGFNSQYNPKPWFVIPRTNQPYVFTDGEIPREFRKGTE